MSIDAIERGDREAVRIMATPGEPIGECGPPADDVSVKEVERLRALLTELHTAAVEEGMSMSGWGDLMERARAECSKGGAS